ncbi:MAG: FkbM family methyltransferase [Xanthomonadales bacterium]|nr:FkbM family methyltransferase [Xanthomonadales bacterium]
MGTSAIPASDSRLEHLRHVWQALGRDDPLWAVLSQADKRGGRWQREEFFATGRAEVDYQLARLTVDGLPRARRLALDFGSGAGRLSRALAAHFGRVIGLDVSPSMVEVARRLNGDLANLEFRENASAGLDGIADASVDFVFSHIVLQHIPAPLALGYVEEFFRVLAPGGVAVFQFVAGTDGSRRGRLFALASNRWLNPVRRIAWRRREVFEMHALEEAALREMLARHPQLRLLHACDDHAAGPGWHGRRWSVANEASAPLRLEQDGRAVYVDAADEQIGAALAAGQAHEPHVARVLRRQLGEGDVMLDIGANLGVFSLLAAECVGPAGRVIAVEPVAANRVLLARSAQENGFRHVELIAAAASDVAGTIQLRTHPSTSNSAMPAAAGARLRAAGGATISVAAIVLDEQLVGLERLDLVKVDVVGMEPLALRGLERTLRRLRPALVTEFHPWAIERAAGGDPAAFLDGLLALYPAITILHRDGAEERCASVAEVMAAWRAANEAAAMDGRLHLDLLLLPE